MNDSIFISYRRDDAAGDAGRLADHLHRRFGKARVFMDIDDIEPGTDFAQVLVKSLQQTAIVLVVIGPRWISLRNVQGERRLDDLKDFVRLEVEAALNRNVTVVPVLVQGATMPRAEDLPASLAPLVKRQAIAIDHGDFHHDAERLCDRLASLVAQASPVRRWWPAAAIAVTLALGLAGYLAWQSKSGTTMDPELAALMAQAAAQRDRNQFVAALATLATARERSPASTAVRDAQENIAMDWIRNVRVEGGKGSFADAIRPALAVIDTSLTSATGAHRADLLAHSGFAKFLLRRDGDRRLNPADAYQEALAVDPTNPYANAMLAHWILFQDSSELPRAVPLFDTALKSGRAVDAVRSLQWAAYRNARTAGADVQFVKIADAVRRDGSRLSVQQLQDLWAPYSFGLLDSHATARAALLDALPPDDHILTLNWAFADFVAKDERRRQTIRYYVALLHARAGRHSEAMEELRALEKEAKESTWVRDAVRRELGRNQPTSGARVGR